MQEPRNLKRKQLAGMEEVEEQPPASGDQVEQEQEQEEIATMDQAGELHQPKPLRQGEDGAMLLAVLVVSSLPDLLSGTRMRVLPWEGDLTTVGPVCGEPNLSQECLDLQEVSCPVSCTE